MHTSLGCKPKSTNPCETFLRKLTLTGCHGLAFLGSFSALEERQMQGIFSENSNTCKTVRHASNLPRNEGRWSIEIQPSDRESVLPLLEKTWAINVILGYMSTDGFFNNCYEHAWLALVSESQRLLFSLHIGHCFCNMLFFTYPS